MSDEHRIYAGCNTREQVCLFKIVDGEPVALRLEDWLKVLDAWGAEPGEMLIVHLTREGETP